MKGDSADKTGSTAGGRGNCYFSATLPDNNRIRRPTAQAPYAFVVKNDSNIRFCRFSSIPGPLSTISVAAAQPASWRKLQIDNVKQRLASPPRAPPRQRKIDILSPETGIFPPPHTGTEFAQVLLCNIDWNPWATLSGSPSPPGNKRTDRQGFNRVFHIKQRRV